MSPCPNGQKSKLSQPKNKECGWLRRQHRQHFRCANTAQRQGNITALGGHGWTRKQGINLLARRLAEI